MTIPKKVVYIVRSLILVLIIAGASFFIYNQVQIKKEHDAKIAAAKKEKEDKQKKKIIFKDTIKSFKDDSTSLASDAETIGNKYYNVWSDTIYNESVKIDGKTYTDFNKALQAQNTKNIFDGTESNLETSIDTVKDEYNDLKNNVTSETESEFNEVDSYYKSLMKFVNLAKEPSGNFNTFSDNYNDAKTNYIEQMNNLGYGE
ncbi:hypothetical protein H4G06_002309 [Listeria monocytogenes]|nr:hypothetical protein [Listeria monocytogenes]